MTIRLKDIAAEAGVSIATASLALSGNPRIPESTRARICDLARAMGYKGNVRRGSDVATIAIVLLPNSNDPHLNSVYDSYLFHESVLGVADEATLNRGVLQVLHYKPAPGDDHNLADMLISNFVQGAILFGGFDERAYRSLLSANFPFICMGQRELADAELSWISSDYVDGCFSAVKHLIDLGHRNIGLVGPANPSYIVNRLRILGYRSAIDAAGLTPGPSWFASSSLDETIPIRQWVSQGSTAVFATDYRYGARILRICAEEGIRVPSDLAVVCFDDGPGAELLQPPITAVRQPLREASALATRTLFAWLNGVEYKPVQILLRTKLVIRMSCGARARR